MVAGSANCRTPPEGVFVAIGSQLVRSDVPQIIMGPVPATGAWKEMLPATIRGSTIVRVRGVTVSCAGLLVMELMLLLTVTVYPPASVALAAGIFRVEFVFPFIMPPLNFHW